MSDKQNDLERPVEQMRAESTGLRRTLCSLLVGLGALYLSLFACRNWKTRNESRPRSMGTLYPMPVELPAQAPQLQVRVEGGEDEGPEPLPHGRFRAIKTIGEPTIVEGSDHDDYSAER